MFMPMLWLGALIDLIKKLRIAVLNGVDNPVQGNGFLLPCDV